MNGTLELVGYRKPRTGDYDLICALVEAGNHWKIGDPDCAIDNWLDRTCRIGRVRVAKWVPVK